MRWLILFILCCSFVSAVDIEFNQNNYASFETVLVKINFTEDLVGSLMPANVFVQDVTVAGKKIVKVDDIYYVYFYLPFLEEGSYNFQIKDITVRENGLTKKDFDKKFDVVSRSSVSVRPGIIYLELGIDDQPKLGFDITNRGNSLDFGLVVDGRFLVLNEKTLKLNPGNEKRVDVTTDFAGLNESLLSGSFKVNYNGFIYTVPIIIKRPIVQEIVNETVEPVIEDEIPVEVKIPENSLVFDVIKNGGNKIDLVLGKSEVKSGDMYFRNDYSNNLENVSFALEGLESIVTYKYSGDHVLKPKELEFVTLDINTEKNLDKDYSGVLIVSASGLRIELPIIIKLKKEEVKPVVNETKKEVKLVVPEKTSKAWIVFVVLGIFIIVFFVMYFKGRRDRKDFNRFISEVSRK